MGRFQFDDEAFPSHLEQLVPELQEDDPLQDDVRHGSVLSSLIECGLDVDSGKEAIPAYIRQLLDAVPWDDPLCDQPPSKPFLPRLKGSPIVVREVPGKGLGAVASHRIPAGSIILDDPFVLSVQEPVREPTDEGEATELLGLVLVQLISQYMRLPTETRRQLASLHPHVRAGTREWLGSHMGNMGVGLGEPELDFVARLYFTFNTNEFSMAMPGGGPNWSIGRLFLATSRINHSCQPNTKSRQTSDGHKIVTATRDIDEGEELTLRYLDHKLFSRSEWQAETQRTWGFVCNCPGCEMKSDD